MPIPPDIKRLYYGYDWQVKIRPRELKRAQYCCERCHRPWKPLDLAHLDGDPSNRDPANLCVLCRPCHRAHDYPQWAYHRWLTQTAKKDNGRLVMAGELAAVSFEEFHRRKEPLLLILRKAV